MAEDPRSQADTEDVPAAREAFEATGRPADREPSYAVAQAAALLSVVRPKSFPTSEYDRVIAETRDLLGVEPVDPFGFGRESVVRAFDALGRAGEQAMQLLLEERRRPREPEEPEYGPTASSLGGRRRRVMEELRPSTTDDRETVAAVRVDAARELFAPQPGSRRREAVNKLVAASLLDDDPLVQVAASAAALRIDPKNPLAETILLEADRDASDEIAELSRTILIADRRSETRRVEIEHPRGESDPASDSAIVHGTWARWGRWWRPDGDLHRYLREEQGLFPHLYQGPRPFEWSGYFSFRAWAFHVAKDWHRHQAADSLAWWAHRTLASPPDLIGHSYGGSISMMATQAEKTLRGLILLSPAVHRTCLPNPENYEQALHVTTRRDLVLLADLSIPQMLDSLPNMTRWQIRRKGLTGHACTHDPQAWQESGLTDHVRDIWLPTLSPRP